MRHLTMRMYLLGLRISWLKIETWLNPLPGPLVQRAMENHLRAPITYACNKHIVSLHSATSEVVGSHTACRSSRQKDGLPRNAKEKKIPQSGSVQAFQISTTCNWLLGRNKHERHL